MQKDKTMVKTYVQAELSKKLKKEFVEKLNEEGMTQQGFLLSRIRNFLGKTRKKKRKS